MGAHTHLTPPYCSPPVCSSNPCRCFLGKPSLKSMAWLTGALRGKQSSGEQQLTTCWMYSPCDESEEAGLGLDVHGGQGQLCAWHMAVALNSPTPLEPALSCQLSVDLWTHESCLYFSSLSCPVLSCPGKANVKYFSVLSSGDTRTSEKDRKEQFIFLS